MTCNCCSPCNSGCSGAATPYYNHGTLIQEEHCVPKVVQVFVTALSSSSSFVMPLCNASVVITFNGLVSIQIGSYLWNMDYGYLRVAAFDPYTGLVTIVNDCTSGNADPGTVIPQCSLFNVVDPPCNCT